MIEAIKAHIPIRTALQEAGVNLNQDKGICPFHNDKHPSLTIKGNRWKCWSCGEGGDIIDFIAKFYGLDIKGAIKLLADRAGIKRGPLTYSEKQVIEKARREREKKQEIVAAFRQWEQGQINEISETLRAYRRLRATRTTFTEGELIRLAEIQSEVDIFEYRYSILCGRDDLAKLALYKEMKGA